MNQTDNRQTILSKMRMPGFTEELIDFFFDEAEQAMILNTQEYITNRDYDEPFLSEEYKRGVISKDKENPERYLLSDFYTFLDVFVVSRREKYSELSKEQRRAIDHWCFEKYQNSLTPGRDVIPTDDVVLPLPQLLERIENDDRPVYLNYCDCRSFAGDCGLPQRTCISYRSGINTYTDRGISERIDKERAKEVAIAADQAGLMHTSNANGICNCCGDCCYLFRSQRARQSEGIWPVSEYIIQFDESKCVGCGSCVKRCHLKVFTKTNQRVYPTVEKCVGCGICVSKCPTKALQLIKK